MKKIGLAVLIVIVILISFKISPVWVHRLFGYEGQTDKVFSPYWINNEEYCYVRVKSYFIPINVMASPSQTVDDFLRGPNVTFYIYKVNINQPSERKLIREISEKVNFCIAPHQHNTLDGREFRFRRLDNGELILLIRGRSKDITYKMNIKGKILMKWIPGFDYDSGSSLDEISPDGKKSLIYHQGVYIKDIASGNETLFFDRGDKYAGATRWIYKNELIVYRDYSPDKKEWWKNIVCEIYLLDEKKENINLVFSGIFKNYDEFRSLILDAALSPTQDLIFLSKIGIFKKENEKWQMLKDLKDMDFNFFSPNWSPDGKRLVGVLDDKNIKVFEVKDLLKD